MPFPLLLPIALAAPCVALLLLAERAQNLPAIAVSKLAASSCFVWAALAAGALDTRYGRFVLGGLALSWLGDALLVPPGRSRWFELGIAAFLLGHVCYAAGFASAGIDGMHAIAASLAVVAAAFAILRWLGPHVPASLRPHVMAYVVVIGAMVIASVATRAAGDSPLVVVGALGFAVSDLSVARARFVSPGFQNAAWGLPLYFGSQLVLAYTTSLA